MEGYRYCLASNQQDTIYAKNVNDLLLSILDILHSMIIHYKCDGCYYCCLYYSYDTERDKKWLCEFDFSKTLQSDLKLYFKFYSEISIKLNMTINKESYQIVDGWPIIESKKIWEFTPNCLKDLFANKLKIE
jgi:hypothetical protein